MTKLEWLEKNGFNLTREDTYCIVGEDTYAIKNYLKAAGCRYSPLLGWHCADQIKLPEGYKFLTFHFDELLQWNEEEGNASYFEKAKILVEKRKKALLPPSKSQYMGEVGERFCNLTAVYKSARGFAGKFGWTNIYRFNIGDNVLTWFTAKDLDFEPGEVVDLTATVKKHEEFREVKTTVITRAIVKSIETDKRIEE